MSHILPEKCPTCGEVVRNDMQVVVDKFTRQRKSGHVQFACNYEVEIPAEVAGQPAEKRVIRECRKGKIWPQRAG